MKLRDERFSILSKTTEGKVEWSWLDGKKKYYLTWKGLLPIIPVQAASPSYMLYFFRIPREVLKKLTTSGNVVMPFGWLASSIYKGALFLRWKLDHVNCISSRF